MYRSTYPGRPSVYRLLAIFLVILPGFSAAIAQTPVSGAILSNTTWDLAGSPYMINGNTTVWDGVTLTIDPGVEVKYTGTYALIVEGSIIADGTPTDTIRFSRTYSGGTGWQLTIDDGYGRFDHVVFDSAWRAITLMGAESPTDSVATITNCKFINFGTGVDYSTGSASHGYEPCRVFNCVFDNSAYFPGSGTGVSGYGDMEVVQCRFLNMGRAMEVGGQIGVYSSVFCGNNIGVRGARSQVVNCRFFNNDYGIYLFSEYVDDDFLIKDNIIMNNDYGISTQANLYDPNTICNSTTANIAVTKSATWGPDTIYIQNQCFCETDSATLETTILNIYDDGTRPFSVFMPVQSCDSTAIAPVDCATIPPCGTVSADFSFSISGGNNVTFTSTSGGTPTRYFWDYGDGTSEGRGDSTFHTYADTGTYTVRLFVKNGCDHDTIYKDVTITCIPLTAAANSVPLIWPYKRQFNDLSVNGATSWAWDFGDGNTSTLQNPIHSYDSIGTFIVTLIASNPCSADTVTLSFFVGCLPNYGGFTYSNDGTGTVTFSDTSSDNSYWWFWDFGDGDTLSAENPVHVFADTGTFNVCQIASNGCHDDTTCQMVAVPCISAAASWSYSNSGGDFTFSDSSSGYPTSYHWDFDDGDTSNLANPVHTFAPGTYDVCLIVSNACSSDTLCTTISTSCPFPDAAYLFSGAGTTYSFNDITTNSPTSWDWNFGDGGSSTLENPVHTFPSTGLYLVCLVASNACGSDTICQTVNVGGGGCLTPDAAFTFTGGGTTVIYNDISTNSPASWSWDFGDGGTDTIQNPSHTYSGPGTYTVCLVATNGCGVDTTCQTVVVTCTAPTASYVYTSSVLEYTFSSTASGGPTSWLWSFGDGGASFLEDPVHLYDSAGVYTVCLITSNACSSDTFCQNITVACPIPSAGFTYSTSGTTVSFNNLSTDGVSWDWDFIIGSSTDENPVFTFPAAGSYTVCLTATNICGTDSACQPVTITCPLSTAITASGPLDLCDGDTVTLSAPVAAGHTYQWFMGGSAIPGKTTSSLDVDVAGSFHVEINDGSCTASSLPVTVTVDPLPMPTITALGPTSFCPGSSVELVADPGYVAYSWNTGATTQNIFATSSGPYVVSVVDSTGCVGPSDTLDLNITGLDDPAICIVTVDTATSRNMVVWEKPLTTAIDSFRIYKETVAAGVYEQIGAKSYGEFSTFVDVASNPRAEANRYKISIIDTCGAESPLSPFHKTIHLTVNKGLGTQWNLIWDNYQGFVIPTYYIWRGIDQNHLFLIDSIAGTMTSWIDIAPPAGDLVYVIEIRNLAGCNPTLRPAGYNSSLSNVSETIDAVSIDPSIQDSRISIFPNPANGSTSIHISRAAGESLAYQLMDLNGKVLSSSSERLLTDEASIEVDLDRLAKGVYLLKTNLNGTISMHKVIVQ